MCEIETSSGIMAYETVRRAIGGELYTMSLTDITEIEVVIAVVNQGIDAHLEACFCSERGDSYEGGERTVGKLILCRTLECSVSPESLPILLRRLFELGTDDAVGLADNILLTLGFDECDTFVGREALGLA